MRIEEPRRESIFNSQLSITFINPLPWVPQSLDALPQLLKDTHFSAACISDEMYGTALMDGYYVNKKSQNIGIP
jgi:hypothetical protein